MSKQFQILIRGNQKNIEQTLDIEQGAGDRGQTQRIKANKNFKYQVQDLGKDPQAAPDQLKVRRKGNHLEITFEGGTEPDLIIEEYYTETPPGINTVIGQAEDGLFYDYIPAAEEVSPPPAGIARSR
jgi:hypothetical protein